MKNFNCALLLSVFSLYATVALAATNDDSLSDVPDLKPEVMRVYGVRSAQSLNDVTIKVVLGAATGPGRDKQEAYTL